jgi:hypothetical protein
MKKMLLLLPALFQLCQAEPVRFEEGNFSIDVPATWKKAEAPPEALALYRSVDNSKGLTLMTMRLSAKDSPTALEKMFSGAKGAAQKSGIPITGEHDEVIDGVTFKVYSVTLRNNVTVRSAMAVVGQRGYSIQGFSGVSDPATDPEISAMVESFRLLNKPATPLAASASPKDEAYEFGQMIGKWAFIALIAGAVGLAIRKTFGSSRLDRSASAGPVERR